MMSIERIQPGLQTLLQSSTKIRRRAYMAGSVGFIAVGALHTVTHLLDLKGSDLEARFMELGNIKVSGTLATSWDLFQGISWLMGLFSFTLGVVNMSALKAAGGTPPLGICMANIAMLGAIAVVGNAHLGPLQVYGGIFGMTMFAIAALGGRRAR